MKRTLLTATTLSLMMVAGSALADQKVTEQTAAATTTAAAAGLVEVEDDSKMVEAFGRSVDEVEDMDIYSAGGEDMGEVEELLMDADGKIVALVAEVGGFLGIGDKEVVLQLDQVQLKDDKLTVDMTKEQLEQLPDWDD